MHGFPDDPRIWDGVVTALATWARAEASSDETIEVRLTEEGAPRDRAVVAGA